MLYLVIERFREGKTLDVYQRARRNGRMLPPGLDYIDSWVSTDLRRCFQLMSCDEPQLLEQWQRHWRDLVEFECIEVLSSAEAAARVLQDNPKHV